MQELEAGDDATGSRATAALQMVDALNEPFEELLVYVWRRHLAAAVSPRRGARAPTRRTSTPPSVTVGFADIVAFTALTNQLDHDRIGDLVEIFESRCADVVAGQHGRVIKSIGDAVLFVNEDPIRAYDTAEGIIEVIGRDPRMPDVRVGLATGSVVMRLGDVFGPPVNMAARLTAVARRNRVIVDRDHRRAAPGGPVRDPPAARAAGARASAWSSRWPSGGTEQAPGQLVCAGILPSAGRELSHSPARRGGQVPIFVVCSEFRTSASTRPPAGSGATIARSSSRARSSTCCTLISRPGAVVTRDELMRDRLAHHVLDVVEDDRRAPGLGPPQARRRPEPAEPDHHGPRPRAALRARGARLPGRRAADPGRRGLTPYAGIARTSYAVAGDRRPPGRAGRRRRRRRPARPDDGRAGRRARASRCGCSPRRPASPPPR